MDGGIISFLTEFAPEGVLTILGGGLLWRILRWQSKVEERLDRLESTMGNIVKSLPDEQAAMVLRGMFDSNRGSNSED